MKGNVLAYTAVDKVPNDIIRRISEKKGGLNPSVYYYIKDNLTQKERVEAVALVRKLQSMEQEDLLKEIGNMTLKLEQKLNEKLDEFAKKPENAGKDKYEIAKEYVGSEEAKKAIVDEIVNYAKPYKYMIKLIKPVIESHLHPGRIAEYLRAGTPFWYYLVVSKKGGFEWIAEITREVRSSLELSSEEEEYESCKKAVMRAIEEETSK